MSLDIYNLDNYEYNVKISYRTQYISGVEAQSIEHLKDFFLGSRSAVSGIGTLLIISRNLRKHTTRPPNFLNFPFFAPRKDSERKLVPLQVYKWNLVPEIAVPLRAENSEYVKKKYGGYFGVFVRMLVEEGKTWDIFRMLAEEGKIRDIPNAGGGRENLGHIPNDG
ncbi:hypothetical protein RND71_023254 [Anisodus tanguticus]|uniref:Uncharacterized protein n=1 Tax=Anisodus tanguticus TaxID=243964 RepID=A0AAE1RSA0_9SOLA|nr:hypothetical protein RND71_023254 [Anisodus tanguticus]